MKANRARHTHGNTIGNSDTDSLTKTIADNGLKHTLGQLASAILTPGKTPNSGVVVPGRRIRPAERPEQPKGPAEPDDDRHKVNQTATSPFNAGQDR
jgi:V8-like Glu-specific endopeptidase